MIALKAARTLVDGHARDDAYVTIDRDHIADVSDRALPGASVVALPGLDLIPGLVDLHSDCLEERAHPRPGREQPLAAALLQLDAEAAAHGITTHYLCATIEDDPLQHRSTQRAAQTVHCLHDLREQLLADHRVHLRVELTSDAEELARELAALDVVGLISYMHHTPGHGQFAADPDAWRSIYANGFTGSDAELQELLADRQRRATHADHRRDQVAAIARDTDTPLASHDDARDEDTRIAAGLGGRICEFPLNRDAAAAARRNGLGVVMGAPNAWRGGSHLGGLAARDVLADGHLTALASDYHPPALLAAAYALAADGVATWADAVALVTTNPATLAGLHDRGSIAAGRRADLIAVATVAGHPVVRGVWRAGTPILRAATAQPNSPTLDPTGP
ncbi:MAG: alpha-D-ribose 1-methylphosphonate 5-triphosphate diphosphatase [Solirubrobacteraceae bacterium]